MAIIMSCQAGSSTKIIIGHDSPLAILIYFQVPGHDIELKRHTTNLVKQNNLFL